METDHDQTPRVCRSGAHGPDGTGCASSGTTLVRADQGDAHVIYRISEEKAFTIALDAYATGTATVVTNLRDGKYETAYLGLKRDARDIRRPGAKPPGPGTADRLSELKTMRDRGLITEEEYQTKRRQILDQM